MKQPSLVLFTLLGAILLSSSLNPSSNSVDAAPIIITPQPSTGRIQIKPPSAESAPFIPQHQPQQQKRAVSIDELLSNIPERRLPQQPVVAAAWINSHGGHVVMDEEDDDLGNELLDLEIDGYSRPDEEDTIEGQILEEEEDDDDDDDDEDVEDVMIQRYSETLQAMTDGTILSGQDWLSENGLEDTDLVPEDFDDEEEEDEDDPVKVAV
ncbi:hypothetical protein BG011_008629 [Mortierella polycephala]|uniref:Uncharacterized protein n=1 Tax=Mortierella polycephala TaxID=41804 RepID=A0A9P6TXA2_9FUNG|nr:hypothetical protein BG011_008629 [Mortierella polycephala]